jgi:hypothetical protein
VRLGGIPTTKAVVAGTVLHKNNKIDPVEIAKYMVMTL